MENIKPNLRSLNHAKTHYEPAPLTNDEHQDIQNRLMRHGLCIKSGKKHARVYRFKGWKNHKRLTSSDFVYVIQADDYRADPDGLINKVVECSKKVFNNSNFVNNTEYENNMVKVEEDLLINHGIVMKWRVSKHAIFKKVVHVCTDRKVLDVLDEYAKNNGNFVTNHIRKTKDGKHLAIFRKLVKIFEEFEGITFYDWKTFRYITKNGKVVCAYAQQDEELLKILAFKRGINDKFDFNLNINTYIKDVLGINK